MKRLFFERAVTGGTIFQEGSSRIKQNIPLIKKPKREPFIKNRKGNRL